MKRRRRADRLAVHQVTRILPYRPEALFALVGDVESYPAFVPWVSSLRVWNRATPAPGVTTFDAEAKVGFAFVKERFSTSVRADADDRTIEVRLIRGPFRHLVNRWRFLPHPQGTQVDFFIDFEFRSKMLDGLLHKHFDRAVSRIIGCFEARAEALHGPEA